jgi:hypothetical protein
LQPLTALQSSAWALHLAAVQLARQAESLGWQAPPSSGQSPGQLAGLSALAHQPSPHLEGKQIPAVQVWPPPQLAPGTAAAWLQPSAGSHASTEHGLLSLH